jgi:hypothetical protein
VVLVADERPEEDLGTWRGLQRRPPSRRQDQEGDRGTETERTLGFMEEEEKGTLAAQPSPEGCRRRGLVKLRPYLDAI